VTKFSMADTQKPGDKKPDLGLLEEDDEFEEFPAEGENFGRLILCWCKLIVSNERVFACNL